MKRLAVIVGVILAALLAVLMVLRPFQRSAPVLNEVALFVRPDGTVDLNGNRYTGLLPLQAALVDACGARPRPIFRLRADTAANGDTVQNVIGVAQKAGCLG